jgi:hypothetical protein
MQGQLALAGLGQLQRQLAGGTARLGMGPKYFCARPLTSSG